MPRKRNNKISPHLRRQRILQLLERAPDEGFSCTEIYTQLKYAGFDFERKTFERDIDDLSNEHAIYEEGHMPTRYLLRKGYRPKYDIRLNDEQIQTLTIALGLLKKLGPTHFSSLVTEIETTLISSLPEHLGLEFDRFLLLQLVQDSLPGKATLKSSENLVITLTALRKSQTFSCQYESQNPSSPEKDPSRIRNFGPIILEMVAGSPYLLVQDLDESPASTKISIKRLRISRVHNAKLSGNAFKAPPPKVYKQFLDSFEAVGGNNNKPINISIICSEKLCKYLQDHELHPSQKILPLEDDQYSIEWKMPLNYRMARMLAGFGGDLYKIRPTELKRWVANLWNFGTKSLLN
ncbi:MAG: WYL domain-containing protein [Oligoflexia bacterium]|nr:WYL domain-containing protein [Oligoflexia bacterium]